MSRPTPALIVAALALVVAGTGSGYAAGTLVTSKQIKDKTIKIKDISPKARAKLRGKKGPVGQPGPTGATGAGGAAGAQGPRGFSAWDPIPSGVTVTGGWGAGGTEGDTFDGNAVQIVTLPGRPPVPPGILTVHLAPNANCPGTMFDPQAAPGHLCVYVITTGAAGGGSPTVTTSPGPYAATSFEVDVNNSGSANWYQATGSWAYQAP